MNVILSSGMAFAATNIDDIFVLAILFSAAEKYAVSVVAGQYLGIGILTAVSLLCAGGLSFLPDAVIRLLGIIPIALGIREWRSHCRPKPTDDDEPKSDTSSVGIWSTALLTVSGGADNLGVYIPLFSGYTIPECVTAVLVFAVLCGVWCLLAQKLSALPPVRTFLEKYKSPVIAAVFVCIGVTVLWGI
ncbi:MAG: cadmium resistance transporter [Clostridia bacterium]|nr:cadmium resistance transporter [Clostridia bacterium]